jgi:hypothetical protein
MDHEWRTLIKDYVDRQFAASEKRFEDYKESQQSALELFADNYKLQHKHIEEKVDPLVSDQNKREGENSRAVWISYLAIALTLADLLLRLFIK